MENSRKMLFSLTVSLVLVSTNSNANPVSLNPDQLKSIAAGKASPVTVADTLHPNIHKNNGRGSSACPGNNSEKCGNMHGIANVPGQSGANPADGAPGFADQLQTVHGGIGAKNKNASGN